MPSITYANERDRPILEGLSARHGMSVVEIVEMAREMILAGFDPIEADGEAFVFEHRPDPNAEINFFFVNSVPEPNAKVDLLQAWEQARRDAKRNAILLRCDVPISKLIEICRNEFAWAKFWSVRGWDATARRKAAENVRAWEAVIEDLKAKGGYHGAVAITR